MSTTTHSASGSLEAALDSTQSAILLIGDQPARLLSCEATLAGLDVQCIRTTSGDDALEQLLQREFAVIVLDVDMPGLDGFETARLIRSHPRLERIPIIFVTGIHFSELDQLRAYEVGAVDHISTPIVPEIFRSKVALLIELQRRRAELEELNRALEMTRAKLEVERNDAIAAKLSALRETQERYRAIFEHPTELTLVLEAVRDADGQIVDWRYVDANTNVLMLLGRTREELIGRSLREVLPDRAQRLTVLCAQVLAQRIPHRYEQRYGGKDMQVCLFPIGENAVVSSAVDVTARTEATRAVQRQSEVDRAEKEWLTAVLNSMNEEVYFTDTQKHYTYANPAAIRQFEHVNVSNVPVEQIVGTLEVFRPDGTLRPLSEAPPLRALAGEVIQGEEQLVRIPQTGELRHREVSAAPVRDAMGDIIGSVSVVRDITEQRRIDQALRASEARARALLRFADEVRGLEDPGEVAFAAARFLAATLSITRCGYGTLDLAAQTITIQRDWSAPGIKSMAGTLQFRDYGSYIEALTRGEVLTVSDAEQDPRTQDSLDALRAIQVRAFLNMPIIESSGTVALLYLTHTEPRSWADADIAFIRDVAERTRVAVERRRSERALRQSEQRLREADKRKDEFLAMLSHELRNPLAAISNIAQALPNFIATHSKASELVATQQRQISQLARLLDDLLDVARITQDRIKLHLEPVSAEVFIQLALDTAAPAIQQRQHRLEISHAAEPLIVRGDKTRLAQCLANLLINAAKFTEPGGDIRVRSRAQGTMLCVEVQDSGIGMTPEFAAHAFDLFVQNQQSLDRSQGGLGIGLAICQRLVEMHGGTVTAASAGLGQGTTFTLCLPLAADAGESVADVAARSPAGLRVLIVDDNKDAADSLELLLQLAGHETRAFYSAQQALGQVAAFRPEVALLDIGLPDMDGYELARRMRECSPGTRLIAVSGYGQAEDEQRAAEAGFADHLVKPVDFARLTAACAAIRPIA